MRKHDALTTSGLFLVLENVVIEKLDRLKPYYGAKNKQAVIRALIAEGLREKKWLK